MKFVKHLILPILLFCTQALFAQQAKLIASVSKNPVGTGEVFEVTYTINANGGNFTPPNFKDFQVVGGPNESQSMSSINGSTSMSISIGYDLIAAREGEFTIGAASIDVNGRTVTSNALNVKVVKGKPVPKNNAASAQGINAPAATDARDLSKSIFIKAVVDKASVYQGEQLMVTYRLYSKFEVTGSVPVKLPELNGFWNEDVTLPAQQLRSAIYNGTTFGTALLKKTVLFPERSGDLLIDPMSIDFYVQVPQQSNSVFDQFFGSYKTVKYNVRSLPVTIHVKPLPDAGKPASFTGAVGRFAVQSSVDKTELKANDALNYKVTVSGSGNIKLLKTLIASFPADFEKYDPKIADTVTNENGESGRRFYNYLLIPRQQGEFDIEPLKFSYFDPSTKRYNTLETKGYHIKVDKGTNQSNVTAFSDADKQDIKMLSQDIRYIKTKDAGLQKDSGQFFGSIGYWLLMLLGPLLCYGAYRYRNKLVEQNSDLVKVRSRRAGKIAAKHMANAQKQLAAGNAAAFYESVFSGLYGYLSDKLNIQYAELNKEKIMSALKGRGVSEKVTSRLMETLDLCEMAHYAPVTHISKQEVFEKAKGIITDIEDEI